KGILEGEKADEVILWLSHPGISARTADDCALVLNVLAEPDGTGKSHDFYRDASNNTRLQVGVADNFTVDKEVMSAFETAVERFARLATTSLPQRRRSTCLRLATCIPSNRLDEQSRIARSRRSIFCSYRRQPPPCYR